jgi:putative transposase
MIVGIVRRLRRNTVDGWYHTFHRGIDRWPVFRDDRDRGHFVELLAEAQERFRLRIHAYSLMDNHWHGVLQTPDANLSAAMQWLHLSHAAWFNARHNRVGPLWQGRFRAIPIEDGAWAYEVSTYVHLNPVCVEEFGLGKRAKKAERYGVRVPSREEATRRMQTLREYPWSSYRVFGGYEKAPEWLTTRVLLSRAGDVPEKRQAAYRREIRRRLTRGIEPSMEERLRDAVAIGTAKFVRHVKVVAQGGNRETGSKRELRRLVTFQDIVTAVESLKGEPWEQTAVRRGDWGKPLAMWAARRYGGMTLREVGEQFGGMDYAAVGMAVNRFTRKAGANRNLRARMKQIAEMLDVKT